MSEETIYVIMCQRPGLEEFAWEARTDKMAAWIREANLQAKNPGVTFRTIKTKLVADAKLQDSQ